MFSASLFMVEKSDRCYCTNYYEMFFDLRINRIFAEEVRKIRESFSVRDIFVLSSRVCGSEDLINLPMIIKRFFIEIICLRYACIVCRMDFDKMFKEIEGYMSRPRKVPLPQNTRISCICIVRTARMMLHGVEIGTLSEE